MRNIEIRSTRERNYKEEATSRSKSFLSNYIPENINLQKMCAFYSIQQQLD